LKVTIGLVQFEIIHRMPESNLAKVEMFLQQANKSHVQVIVFPELFLTGPIRKDDDLIDFSGKYIYYLQQLAQDYKIDIVTGSIIEGCSEGLYNTTYYINSLGAVLGKYNKINLWLSERRDLLPGENISVFQTSYGKVGLCICWDIVRPELFRQIVKKGADFVFCPSYWCTQLYGNEVRHDFFAEKKHVDAMCITRAFENEIIFAYCNAAGKCVQDDEQFPKELIGHSQLTVPFKGALILADHNKEEMLIHTVDTTILEDAEDLYKMRCQILNPPFDDQPISHTELR
jgi:predicted amidohydrolase